MSTSPGLRDLARLPRERPYAPPRIARIASVHEHTLGSVVGADGDHFTGHIGLPFKTSVHCVKRHGQSPQAISDQDEYVGFTVPEAI